MNITDKTLEAFHRIGAEKGKKFGAAPAKKLSLLLRPAFIAPKGKTLLWADFSNIEARVLPWLAATPGAEAKLDIFREVDKDPSLPDVYIRTAGDLLDESAQDLWDAYGLEDDSPEFKHAKSVRQSHGKVPELSLGFGGGVGALMKMAVNYGVYFEEHKAKEVVANWREKNAWAKSFWGAHGRNGSYGLWGAINSAIESPNTIFPVGRVAYVFDPDYLNGTLFCALPCGRLLTYPHIKWEWREVEDKETKQVKDVYQLTFMKAYGRKAMWHGIAAENITQAAAASVLRRTLKRLAAGHVNLFGRRGSGSTRARRRLDELMPVVMHTHDEIVTEVAEDDWKDAASILHRTMETNDEWDEGLPLAAELTKSWWYSKAVRGLKREDYDK